MDVRFSTGLLWRGPVLAAAAFALTACATEMGELQPPPATPAVAAPAPVVAPPPTSSTLPSAPPAPVTPPAMTPPPQVAAAPPEPAATPAPAAMQPPAAPAPISTPAPSAVPPAPPTPVAQRPVEITGVEFQQSGSGGLAVLVTADGPIPTYESFTLPDPPRLVVDIPNAVHAVPQPITARPPLVTAIRSSQYRERPVQIVRVVMDLRAIAPYRVLTAQNQLRVDIGPAEALAGGPGATAPAQPPAATVTKASAKVGKPAVPSNAANGATQAPPAVSPVTSVAAATPVPAPAAAPAPTAASATAQVAPVASSPSPGAGRLSMDFKDADISNLLRIIAEVSGMNVVAGSDVSGKVTVRLVNVEWQQALDVILRINNMGYEMDGNVIRVAPQAKLAAEQRARDEARAREQKAQADAIKAERDKVQQEPLRDEVISINYAKAADVVKNLDRLKTTGRTDVSIVVDDRTNKLLIRETDTSLARMKSLLREIDRPTPQVLIEARLIEATRSFSQSLGIEWGFSGNPGTVSLFTSSVGTTLAVPTTSIPLSISTPATSPTGAVGIVANNLFNGRLALGARISAGESENKVRTLSSPKVATMDNLEAEIKQGSQVPYTTIDSSGRTVVAFQDAFIRLKVTPHITNDRRISMKVEAERSFPGDRVDFAGGFAFQLNTRKATTNVLVSNGATIVIGGLLQSDERWTESRIPWLGKVPVFGSLFKSTSIGPDSKIELLIFLTPTILEETNVS